MNGKADLPTLQRLTFFSGQQLTARDLSELQRVQRERAWLHNRAFHSWGIGIGLAVTGEAGDTLVTVGEGYGVDCLGREIILTEPKTLSVPAVAGGARGGEAVYYLVAGYQDNSGQRIAERRPGVCAPEGTVRLTEEPRLEWLTETQLEEQEGLAVILAKAWIRNCQLSRPLSLAERRSARGSQLPYISTGQTDRGSTNWTSWMEGEQALGVYTRVDTSMARFQATPHYFAHLVGERYMPKSSISVMERGFVVHAMPVVHDVMPTDFTLRVMIPSAEEFPGGLEGNTDKLNSVLGWHVVWMGVEA